jgi:hypothetical protein
MQIFVGQYSDCGFFEFAAKLTKIKDNILCAPDFVASIAKRVECAPWRITMTS